VPEVRKATAADVDALAHMTARAFETDPFWRWMFPGPDFLTRAAKLAAFELNHVHLRHDEVWTTVGEAQGSAMWSPPDKWRQTNLDMLLGVPGTTRIFGRRSLAVLRAFTAVQNAHPPGPHYYLAVLGTDPVHQGKGVGSAVLRPVLERCDAQGLGAFLESSKEENIPFYNRQGFEVTRRLDLPAGAPPVWAMWREPR
jgi:ribosomal protein S18 acetylase RimI-like enzyme